MSVLAIDLGTGSVKVAVVGDDLTVRCRVSRPYPVLSPEPDAAQGDPREWAAAVQSCVEEVLARADGDRPTAVGLSGQMHGLVLLDAGGAPLGPALLWPDTRALPEVERLAAAAEATRAALANPLVPGMAGPLLGLLIRTRPDLVARASAAVQPKDWLRVALAGPGALAADPSDASATLLWDLPADGWSTAAATVLGVPAELLPAVLPSHQVCGTTSGALGLPAGLPVVTGAADTACAALGTGTVRAGRGQVSIGTGAQVLVPLAGPPRADPNPVTHTYRAAVPSSWYRMGAVQNAGLALERVLGWLGADWPQALSTLAEHPARPDRSPVFLPHLSGERTPWLDPALRGAWVGLALEHERADLLRSALLGVACGIADAFDAVAATGADPGRPLLVGGGSVDGRWRRLLADVLGTSLVAVAAPDAAVLGAAALALAGTGRLALDQAASVLDDAARAGAVTVEPTPGGRGWVGVARQRFEAARLALRDLSKPALPKPALPKPG